MRQSHQDFAPSGTATRAVGTRSSRPWWPAFWPRSSVFLLALSCASFGRSALEVESRARIAQEGILAAQSIACDFGGFLADSPGRAGGLTQYSFTSWDISQEILLILYFQGVDRHRRDRRHLRVQWRSTRTIQPIDRRVDHDRPARYGILRRSEPGKSRAGDDRDHRHFPLSFRPLTL